MRPPVPLRPAQDVGGDGRPGGFEPALMDDCDPRGDLPHGGDHGLGGEDLREAALEEPAPLLLDRRASPEVLAAPVDEVSVLGPEGEVRLEVAAAPRFPQLVHERQPRSLVLHAGPPLPSGGGREPELPTPPDRSGEVEASTRPPDPSANRPPRAAAPEAPAGPVRRGVQKLRK